MVLSKSLIEAPDYSLISMNVYIPSSYPYFMLCRLFGYFTNDSR